MKLNPIVLAGVAGTAGAIVAITMALVLGAVGTTGEDAEAGPPAGLADLDGGGGDLAPYLVGHFQCGEGRLIADGVTQANGTFEECYPYDTIFRFINPTSELLQKDAALFDDEENLVGCFNDNLSGNDLEIDDLGYMLDQGMITLNGTPVTELPGEGVIKVVVLDPTIPNAVDALRSGLIGYAEYALVEIDDGSGWGGSREVALQGIPRQVVLEDAYGGPNQDIAGPDGRPDELAKIIDNCFPPEATPTPTVTPTVTNTPTATPTVPTATPTSTSTPFVPVVTSTPTPTSTSETGSTCFEWPPGSGTIICF
jgi:hypothetical protein